MEGAAAAVTASAVPSGDEEGHSHQNETGLFSLNHLLRQASGLLGIPVNKSWKDKG